MSEINSMDDILSDKPIDHKPAEVAPPAEGSESAPVERPVSRRQAHRDLEQAAQGRVRDPETGQYLPKQAEPAPEAAAAPASEPAKAPEPAKKEETVEVKPPQPKQELTEKERAFLRAAEEERRKRQDMERQLAAMKAAQPKEPEKTFWDDPEAALKRHQEEVQKAVVGTRLSTSETIARSRYNDFDEKVAIFSELAQTTPGLAQQMLAAPDPAEFAYRAAANHKMLQDAGSIEQLLAKARAEAAAEARTKLEAELKEREERMRKEREALPASLSHARGTTQSRPVWSGPTAMDDILKG